MASAYEVVVNQAVTPILGLPVVERARLAPGTRAAVLGAGHCLGSPFSGTENAPFFLRTLSKSYTWAAKQPSLHHLDRGKGLAGTAVDLGDIEFANIDSLPCALASVQEVIESLPQDVAPCVIGGDHTTTLPIVQALLNRRTKPFFVVQFDHHLDLQIWNGAPGRGAALREAPFNTNVMSHVSDLVGPGRLIQIGVEPVVVVDRPHQGALTAYLRNVGKQISLSNPALYEPASVQSFVGRGRDIYVTLDVDVLTDGEMLSTGYPSPVGLQTREVMHLLNLIAAGNHLIGFDLVEFSVNEQARDPRTLADGLRALSLVAHLLSLVQS